MLDKQLDGSVLFQASDGTEHVVHFCRGAPAKARTDWPVENLGRVLFELGFIDLATLDSTSSVLSGSGELHGRLLISLGKIDSAQMVAGLREQLMRRMIRLFEQLDDNAAYAFYGAANLLSEWGGPELTPIDPYAVLCAGVRARPEHPHIAPTLARLGSAPLVVHPSPSDLQRFGFTAPELSAVAVLRARPLTIPEILASGLAPEHSLRLVLYVLLITRNISLGRREVVTVAPATPSQRADAPESSPDDDGSPSSRHQAAVARVRLKSVGRMQGATGPGADQQAPGARRHPAAEPDPTPPPMRVDDFLGGAAASAAAEAQTKPARPPAPPSAASMKTTTPAIPTARLATPGASAAVPVGDPKIVAWRESIQLRAATIDKEDYFTVLGVPRDVTQSVLQGAYFGLAKMWHPDRLPPELDDVKELAARCFGRISDAFQTLNDAQKRNEYVTRLQQAAISPEEQEKVQRVVEAALDFQKAEVFFKKRDLARADEYAKRALEGDPEQADYLALSAWITAELRDKAGEKDFTEQIRQLTTAVDREPRCERALFYRGMLHKRQGRADAAVRDFRKALELNARNVDAAREVRLYEMRGGKAGPDPEASKPKSSSDASSKNVGALFGKLFKR